MEITKEYLKAKRDEYEAAAKHHENLMHANFGAMSAVEQLIGEIEKDETCLDLDALSQAQEPEKPTE